MEDKPEESRLVEVFRRLRIYKLAPTKERYGFERRKKEVDDEEASQCFLNNDKVVTVVSSTQDKSSQREISIPKEPLKELSRKEVMAEIYRQILIGFVCNLLVLDSGLHEGWSTPTIPMFGHGDPLSPTTDEIGWIVNVLYMGVGIGAVVPFLLMNRIGRKKTLLLATIPKIISWVMIGLANSLIVIILGRILAGVGCGITYSLMPMYLAEISSKRSRGPLGTALAVLLNIGALLVCVIGLWVTRFTMAMLALTIPILFAITFVWLPETSVYLMRKNNVAGAEKTLRWTLAKEDIQEELEQVKQIVAIEDSSMKSSTTLQLVAEMFRKRENKRALTVAFIALTALAFCGAVPILAYQSEIFQKANFDVSTKLCIISSGSIMVLSGFLCVFIVLLTGKRPLLLIGSPLCFIPLAASATFFNLSSMGVNVSSFNWIPMVSVMIYVFGFGLAVNPIPLAIVGEIFPFEMKPTAAILSSLYYAVSTTTIVKYYQVMQDAYGTHVPLWTFSAIGMVLWVLIYKYVPETEGKSLAEIQMELRKEK